MKVSRFKGLVALDIDGTITPHAHEVDDKVIDALNQIEKNGWSIIFITGRTFSFAQRLLKSLPFPYALATQNGALLMHMPAQKKLASRALPLSLIKKIQEIAEGQGVGGAIYTGGIERDRCYYLPSFPPLDLAYALKRAAFLGEEWRQIPSLEALETVIGAEEVFSVKFFVSKAQAHVLSDLLQKKLLLHAPPNKDPYHSDYFVVQVTDALANKGHILQQYSALFPDPPFIIAAGDDYNDASMLKVASLKIVMENAPPSLLDEADIIAPAAHHCGIVQALFQAIERLS